MDKPISLSVKAWIIRQMSVRTMTQERGIETVINHQFDSAYEALEKCSSLEFSGFGKLFFDKSKAFKKMDKFTSQLRVFGNMLENDQLTELRKRNIRMRLESISKNYEHLKKKLDECCPDIRRMEKQDVSPEGTKGNDSEGEGGKTPSL